MALKNENRWIFNNFTWFHKSSVSVEFLWPSRCTHYNRGARLGWCESSNWGALLKIDSFLVVTFANFFCCNSLSLELRLMFRLMDRVSEGIAPMLKCLEEHIVQSGLADMMVAADLITQVCFQFVIFYSRDSCFIKYNVYVISYTRIQKSTWSVCWHFLTSLVNSLRRLSTMILAF